MNAVLAIVHIQPGDKIVKEKDPANPTLAAAPGVVKEEVKEENGKPVIKEEGTDIKSEEEVGEELGGDDQKMQEEEEDMDDEVPYIEDIGTREVAGFIVM